MRVLLSGRRPTDEDGFSLLETVIAMTIAAFAFSTLSLALINGVHTSLLSQQNQQAGDLLSQTVEKSRALGYDSLAMRATDLNTGELARSPQISSCLCYSPTTDTTTTAIEPLAATDPAGGIDQHVTTLLQNGLSYKVRRYVTQPVDAFGATYKRLTIVVSWNSLGKSHTRNYSTIVTSTKRGLPLPDYKFTATGVGLSQCRNPSSTAVYSFTLKNNGARDSWSLANTGGGTWNYYEDTNGNGYYDVADSSLNVAGTPTTGLLEPTGSRSFFAVASVPTAGAAPPPYTWATVFRATSAAQSGYFTDLTATTLVQSATCGGVIPTPTPTASASPSATPSPTATPSSPTQPAASCTSLTGDLHADTGGGVTAVGYYLGNPSYPANTNASLDMPLSRDSGAALTGSTLYSYSQDLTPTVAGRYLENGTAGVARDTASWTYQMPSASSLRDRGALTLYARPYSGATTDAPMFSITVDLLRSDGTVKTANFGTGTYSTPSAGWGCTGFRPFSAYVGNWANSGEDVAANEKLRVSVKVTNGVPVLLAYGIASYPSYLELPYKTGNG